MVNLLAEDDGLRIVRSQRGIRGSRQKKPKANPEWSPDWPEVVHRRSDIPSESSGMLLLHHAHVKRLFILPLKEDFMPRGVRIPDEERRQIFEAIEYRRLTYRAAAREFGKSVGSVSNIHKEGLPAPSGRRKRPACSTPDLAGDDR